MERKQKAIEWIRYDDPDEVPPPWRHLLEEAGRGWNKAWAPYSRFLVGAAVLLDNGIVLSAGNQENAAYPMCLCAERTVLATAASQYPGAAVRALAIRVKNLRKKLTEPATPCGACRQVLYETELRQDGKPITLILQGEEGPVVVIEGIAHLLPFGFDHSAL